MHIHDGGLALWRAVQPAERFAEIADVVGPQGAYDLRRWRAWEVSGTAVPEREERPEA